MDEGWVAALNDLEWRVLEGGLKGVVVDVFCPWQPAQPLAGVIAGEAAKVHGDDLVECLGLAIGLGMERRSHVRLGSSEAHELLEDGGEHRVLI